MQCTKSCYGLRNLQKPFSRPNPGDAAAQGQALLCPPSPWAPKAPALRPRRGWRLMASKPSRCGLPLHWETRSRRAASHPYPTPASGERAAVPLTAAVDDHPSLAHPHPARQGVQSRQGCRSLRDRRQRRSPRGGRQPGGVPLVARPAACRRRGGPDPGRPKFPAAFEDTPN